MEDKTKEIRALSTECPHYCREDQALFFSQLDSEYEIIGISNQKAKFHLAVSRMPR